MKTDTQNYNIDASGQTLGRLSTKIASILLGKNTTNSLKHNVVDCKINVSNASLIKVTGNKMKTSVHKRYSGYPSGLRLPTLSEVSAKKGYAELIRHAVEGMLPKNKLQNERMKNLIITE
jgi:large subunit ribosomal protein L13